MLHHPVLAIGAGVPASEPLTYALRVEAMETWKDHVLFLKLVAADADSAGFVFL